MTTTDRFGLTILGPGAKLSDIDYKFGNADRRLMDRLLRLGAEGHHHDGAVASSTAPAAPARVLATSGGSIAAGQRVFYEVTLVDVNGSESLPSTAAFIDTPAAIADPGAAVLSTASVGGILLPGQYFYVLTAFTTANTQETRAVAPAPITVPVGTATNVVTLLVPTLPTGASGFNVYRKGPGDARYNYVASIAAFTTSWTDDGNPAPDCNRTIPVLNSTNGANAVTLTITAPPAGSTWRLYRTYVGGLWTSSLLHHVVEETAEGSGIIRPTFVDVGLNTLAGQPPNASQQVASPAKILLTDSAEVRGLLPMAKVAGFPVVVTFAFNGSLVGTVQGNPVWVCEFPRASILGIRGALGRGAAPAASTEIFDVNQGSGAVPTMASVFASSGDRPTVAVGAQIGARVPATLVTELLEGDVLTADLAQVGGGATPTDHDALVSVYLFAHGFADTSFRPGVDRRSPTGLVAWFKDAGLTGIANGAVVPTWVDSSGAGRDANEASLQPTRVNGAINGLPAVAFNGHRLKTSVFASQAQPITVFLVAKLNSLLGTQVLLDGNAGEMQLFKDTFPHWALSAGLVVGPTADTAWHIFCITFSGTSGAAHLRVGGGPGVSGLTNFNSLTAVTMGSYGASASGFLNGRIAELLVYKGARTAEDINTPGRYLSSRFALPWVDVD